MRSIGAFRHPGCQPDGTDLLSAVVALKRSAFEHMTKTIQIEELALVIEKVIAHGRLGEVIARLTHDSGHRSPASSIPMNCGSIPEHLIESEFFGYKKAPSPVRCDHRIDRVGSRRADAHRRNGRYPLTAPKVSPRTRYFWKKSVRMIPGVIAMSESAESSPQ